MEQFNKQLENLVKKIHPKVVEYCERIKRLIPENTLTLPQAEVDDEYRWTFYSDNYFCQLVLQDSMIHEGTTQGVNWNLVIDKGTGDNTECLADITLYNYTHYCWIDLNDEKEILHRLAEVVNWCEITTEIKWK